MTMGLSFMFQAVGDGAKKLGEALTESKVKTPDILHYLWVVEVPGIADPSGHKTFLLTTVYDESFEAYISDLVQADYENTGGLFFDGAAKSIVGLQDMVPVHEHLSEFVHFIAQHDLTQTNPAGKFTAFYPWTVALIHAKLGPHQAPAVEE